MDFSQEISDDFNIKKDGINFFYENLYPWVQVYQWLTCSKEANSSSNSLDKDCMTSTFSKREISFTCQSSDNISSDEYFLRWQSFQSGDELKRKILNMKDSYVRKFDIGAIYSFPIADKEKYPKEFKPVKKELVFDIDMNDFDDVRTCCKSKKVCKKCWTFLSISMKVLHQSLREDFDFHHILWVYSGRRGIHCWVFDSTARSLSADSRSALCDYLNLCNGSESMSKKVSLPFGSRLHPSIDRSFCIVYSHFSDLLHKQDFFSSNIEAPDKTRNVDKILGYIPQADYNVRKEISKFLSNEQNFNSSRFFGKLCEVVDCMKPGMFQQLKRSEQQKIASKIPSYFKEIVLSYGYPRLDIHVSEDIGHLLKAPFCVHSSTGRICVPIPFEYVDKFDPLAVPTLGLLRQEFDSKHRGLKGTQGTSLHPYIEYFENHVLNENNF